MEKTMDKLARVLLLGVIGVYTQLNGVSSHAMESLDLKDELKQRQIDTLVIGGLRVKPTDPSTKPDFQADGFDIVTLNKILDPLCDLISSDQSSYGLTCVKYEHVGWGFDPDNSKPAFQKLLTLLKPGGKFEYSSSWGRFSFDPYDVDSTAKDFFLPEVLGFQVSSIYDKVIYTDAEEWYRKEEELLKIDVNCNVTNKSPSVSMEAYNKTNLSQNYKDSICEFWGIDCFKNEKKQHIKGGFYIKSLEVHLENMAAAGFGSGTLPYERSKLYLEKSKVWNNIMRIEEENSAKETKQRVVECHGLDEEINAHFSKSLDPFLINVDEESHKKYFLKDSKIPLYMKLFKDDLSLKILKFLINKVNKTHSLYSFTIQGEK